MIATPRTRSRGQSLITVRRLAPAAGMKITEIRRAVLAAAGRLPIASVSIAIVDDGAIARVHDEFMGDPTATDVLTFDLRDDVDGEAIEGEIIVSADTARREAARRGLDSCEELLRYIIHGVLHLAGLDDATPAQRRRMRRAEDDVLVLVRGRRASKPRAEVRARRGSHGPTRARRAR